MLPVVELVMMLAVALAVCLLLLFSAAWNEVSRLPSLLLANTYY